MIISALIVPYKKLTTIIAENIANNNKIANNINSPKVAINSRIRISD